MEGTNTGRENAEGMASVGVSLTAELGHGACAKRLCPSSVMALPLPERWRAPMGGQCGIGHPFVVLNMTGLISFLCADYFFLHLNSRVAEPGRPKAGC